MTAKIEGPSEMISPKLDDGTANPFFDLVNYADLLGAKATLVGESAELDDIEDDNILSVSTVSDLVSFGAEVYGMPAWIEVGNKKSDIPDVIDKRSDEEKSKGGKVKWEEWNNGNHTPLEIGGKTYIASDSQGGYLKGSEIVALLDSGYSVKTKKEMKKIKDDNTPKDGP